MSFSPSYITKNRFGVFYFRCRIPIEVRKRYNLQKTEVKKSLKTGNRKEALRLARILWVDMAKKNFMSLNEYIEIYDDIKRQDEKLKVGRDLLEELNGIADDPASIQADIDDFFERQSEYGIEALKLYDEYLARKKQERQVQQAQKKVIVEEQIENIVKTGVKPYLSELMILFYEDYKDGWKSNRTWEKDVEPIINAFIEIIGDKKADELSIDDVVNFKNNYKKLPKRYTLLKKYSDKSIPQIIAMTIPDKDRQAPKTIKKKYDIIKQFINWMDDNNYLQVRNTDLTKCLKKDTKKIRVKGGKKSFTDDELKALFESKEYTVKGHKEPSHHWIPLIGLYTGARLGEICQLRKVDVVKDEKTKIWYFNFCDYEDESSVKKTDAAKRKMPVHSQLVKLGFLDYMKGIRKGKRLFEKLEYTPENKYSGATSKWFGRYRKKCGVDGSEGQRKVFHTFRNTLINELKQNGVDVLLAKEMVGHKGDDITYDRYADPLGLKQKKKYLNKVQYDIDFSKMRQKRWN